MPIGVFYDGQSLSSHKRVCNSQNRMSSLFVFLVLFFASKASAENLREGEVAPVDDTHMTYARWSEFCVKAQKVFNETHDKAAVEVETAGDTATKNTIKAAYESFQATVLKIKQECDKLVALPNTAEQLKFKGQPNEATELDKASRFIGRQVMSAIISAHNHYIIYKVVFNSEKEKRNYVAASKVIDNAILSVKSLSSFATVKRIILSAPAIFAIHSILF
ncbi:hypothetical protein, conserved [Babesia ovata]|uniref:Uncharacterized protein n=1 Tax=Babesia ovata TaxID=189622 RepID=A0A2H6KE70_9APIC|nr:uncharacterized protein BOVATA_027790 [Babesia ovata]GBE61286.1 hypothetical protein, conserved [Babesia ovata]